jgi:hypothetical protein
MQYEGLKIEIVEAPLSVLSLYMIPRAILEGRNADARRMAAAVLRAAIDDRSLLDLLDKYNLHAMAMLIAPEKRRGRGAPRKTDPAFWNLIGDEDRFLRHQGVGRRAERIAILAKQFGMSSRTIEKTLAYYGKRYRKHLATLPAK